MSHFNNAALKTALSAVFLGILTLPMTAHAAISAQQNRPVAYKTSLSAVEGLDARVLDWRNPSLDFTFDASETDWVEGLELLLSADPMGQVSRLTPLMIQFNGGDPMPVITRGQGFDARIKLDSARIRPQNNTIKFTYNAPTGAACLTPQHGGWRLDFKNSLVIIKGRAKVRNFDISNVEDKLKNPITAPKSVRLIARGPNTSKLQALAAQGVGLRMESVPEFKTVSGSSEFDIILGRRDQLYSIVSDKRILDGTGARILMHKGRKMRLVITGDTDDDVMAGAKAFATNHLPNTNGRLTTPGELIMQTPLKASAKHIDGESKLSAINSEYFEYGWGPKPKTIKFNVNDPIASKGELLLRIASGKSVSANSRVSVDLNGNSLGFTTLNRSRKSVAFKIPAGQLQGTDNILSITPELDMRDVSGCNFTQESPGFYLGSGSRLKIEAAVPSPVAELSKVTATGGAFSIGKAINTVVVLPSSSSRDYNASLKILAKLAQSSGYGWTEANYLRSANFSAIGTDKNILVIGPNSGLNGAILDSAPKGLTSALKGQSLNGSSIASTERFAASDEATTLRLYAERQAIAGRIRKGGVAAIYPSPISENNVIGVITNVPGRSFASVADQLLKPHAWNNMEGSVARWDNSKLIMAQTAMTVPGFIAVTPKQTTIGGFNLPDINWPKFALPKFDKEAFEFGEVDMSTVREKFENLKTGTKKSKIVTPRLKPETPAVPELRGTSDTPTTSSGVKLKAWAADKLSRLKKSWNKFELNKSFKAAQAKVKPMGDIVKDKLGLDPSVSSSALATMIIAALAFFFFLLLLLRLMRPSRKR